jgi:hypothetical protein
MTITFESNNDVIVYTLERIIAFARDNQYIFLAQSVWWISSILGLQQGLVIHIDNLKARSIVGKLSDNQGLELPDIDHTNIDPSRIPRIQNSSSSDIGSEDESVSISETNVHNEVIENCELFLEQSKQEQKAIGRQTRQVSRAIKEKFKPLKTFGTQT